MRPLGRESLPVLLGEQLTKDIGAGVWSGLLPGYRTLCGHYNVSQKTCKAALALLEARGVVAAAEPGKRRRILGGTGPAPVGAMNLLVITDSPVAMDGEDALLLGKMTEYWLRRGGEVRRKGGNLRRLKKPLNLLRRWIEEYAASHLLFFNPPRPWTEAVIKTGIPCYFLGGEFRRAQVDSGLVPGSSHSLERSMEMVLRRAKKLGHRRLLIPTGYGMGVLRRQLEKILSSVYGGGISERECAQCFPVFSETNPDSYREYWRRELETKRPTLVVLSHAFEVLSLYGHCMRAGIDLARDLSVVCMDEGELLDWLSPRPTCLRYPYEKSLTHFRDWVRKGCGHGPHKYFALKWSEGETLQSPPP